MAVVPSNVRYWEHIPIRFVSYPDPEIQRAVDALNKQLGFDLFAPLEGTDRSVPHVEFNVVSSGCSEMGQQYKQPQSINLRSPLQRRLVIHEMMHCAGFEHEQFHVGYPWNRSDLPDPLAAYNKNMTSSRFGRLKPREMKESKADAGRPRAGSGGSGGFGLARPRAGSGGAGDFGLGKVVGGAGEKETGEEGAASQAKTPSPSRGVLEKLQDPVNQRIYEYLLDLDKGGVTYADGYLKDLRAKQFLVESLSNDCDFDSIMMYQDFFEAAKAAQNKGRHFMFSPKTSGHSDELSETDVAFVKRAYQLKMTA